MAVSGRQSLLSYEQSEDEEGQRDFAKRYRLEGGETRKAKNVLERIRDLIEVVFEFSARQVDLCGLRCPDDPIVHDDLIVRLRTVICRSVSLFHPLRKRASDVG